jgi:hypothetical protein
MGDRCCSQERDNRDRRGRCSRKRRFGAAQLLCPGPVGRLLAGAWALAQGDRRPDRGRAGDDLGLETPPAVAAGARALARARRGAPGAEAVAPAAPVARGRRGSARAAEPDHGAGDQAAADERRPQGGARRGDAPEGLRGFSTPGPVRPYGRGNPNRRQRRTVEATGGQVGRLPVGTAETPRLAVTLRLGEGGRRRALASQVLYRVCLGTKLAGEHTVCCG